MKLLYTVGRNVKCCNHYVKYYHGSSKNRLLYDLASLLLGIHQKNQKQDLEEIFAYPFIAALFTVVKM